MVFLRYRTERCDFLDSPGRMVGDHKSNLSGSKVALLEVNECNRLISTVDRNRQQTVGAFVTLPLSQLRILRFGFFQNGNVCVGVFPQGEKALIFESGFIPLARENIRPAESQVSQGTDGLVLQQSG